MMNKYYSDADILHCLDIIADHVVTREEDIEIIRCAIERIKSKQQQISFQASRLRTAAEHIGFTMIDELQSYE